MEMEKIMDTHQKNKIDFLDYASALPSVRNFHMHEFYEIYLLLEGELNFYIDKSCYHLLPGSLIILNDLEVHKAVSITGMPHRRIYIHIPQEFFHRYGTSITPSLDYCFINRVRGERNLLLLDKEEFLKYEGLYFQMKKARYSDSYGSELLMETYLVQLLLLVNNLFMQRTSSLPNLYSEDVRRIVKYVEEHIRESLSLDQIADDLSISKYYMCHQFKQQTGTTIFQHLLLHRISLAKSLLQQGKNASETSELAGFGNYTNFITSFREITGYSPKQYQLQFRTPKELCRIKN